MDLVVIKPDDLSTTEEESIQHFIAQAIEKNKHSRIDLAKLSIECVAMSTATQARAKSLAQQGVFGRIWGDMTGSNHKLQAANVEDLAKAQYVATKMLVHLAEQNTMTLEVATIIGNRVNYLGHTLDNAQIHIKQIWLSLGGMAKRVKAQLAEHSDRIEKLERNQDLLFWKETIEDRSFNGIQYSELNSIEKMICIVGDFYKVSRGNWSYFELIFLRSVLREIAIDTNLVLSLKHLLLEFSEKPALIKKIITDTGLDDRLFDSFYHSPLLHGILKIDCLHGEENYIVRTIADHLEAKGGEAEQSVIRVNLTSHYLYQVAAIDTGSEVKIFDLAVELLSGMEILSTGKIKGALLNNELDEKTNLINKQIIEIEKINNKAADNINILETKVKELSCRLKEREESVIRHQSHNRKIIIMNEMYDPGNSLPNSSILTKRPWNFFCTREELETKYNLQWMISQKSIINKGENVVLCKGNGEEFNLGSPCSGTIFQLVNNGSYTRKDIIGVISSENDSIEDIEEWLIVSNSRKKISDFDLRARGITFACMFESDFYPPCLHILDIASDISDIQ